jgi:16S rRNA U516 pseudouridylate synthase RsuA-like enzyme
VLRQPGLLFFEMRLNRYLALCGLGSRRACEALILEGRVTVNGRRIQELATSIEAGDRVSSADWRSLRVMTSAACHFPCDFRKTCYQSVRTSFSYNGHRQMIAV